MSLKNSTLLAGAASLLLAACTTDSSLLTAPAASVSAGGSRDVSGAAVAYGPGLMTSAVGSNICAEVGGGGASVPSPGLPIQTWACHGGANQQFVLQSSGAVTAYDGALCLDVWGAQANDGDKVVAWTCHGGSNQRWTRTAAGELRSAVNGKCLDLWGARGENGAKLVVWSCHGGANQKWAVNDAGAAALSPPALVATDTAVGGSAELPRTYLTTSFPTKTGRTITVNAGGDLQTALDAAQPGDEVVLAAGATFTGNFVLRPKSGMTSTQWITVRSSGTLPAEGVRVTPANAAQMPKLLTPNAAPALAAAPGAQGWRVTGLELGLASSNAWSYSVVSFGSTGAEQDTPSEVPSRLVLDRSYLHASPTQDVRRCLLLNSASSAVIDSYLAECHSRDSESQGILGYNGPGPFKIVNNHIEGGHEVIAFGGADPSVPNLVPSDMEIRRNHIMRPNSWRGVWGVKNLVELKTGQRILMEGNVFENNWLDAQNGFAFVWWAINAEGNAPWSVTQDITFRYNRVRGVMQGFNISAGNSPTSPTRRITIAHNVVNGPDSTNMRMFQIDGGLSGITIVNNTALGGEHNVVFATGTPIPSFIFRNNVASGQYTFYSNGGFGAAALPAMGIAAANVTGNVLATQEARMVPAGNAQAMSRPALGFVDYGSGDLSLSSSSPFRASGSGGSLPGADVTRVNQLIAGVAQ